MRRSVQSNNRWKLVFGLAAGSLIAANSIVAAGAAPPATMQIAMHALNGSGEEGTATLTQDGDKVKISVHLTGEPADASEPAHVHFGRCPIIKAIPAYNVGPIVGGEATDVVDLTWAEITSGKYALNVHQSATELDKYVSCGNIGGAAAPMAIPTEGGGY
jgi:hypothetical protein